MVGPGEARAIQLDRTRMEQALTGDRKFSISCQLGVRYPSLRAMMNWADSHLRYSVRFHLYDYTYHILCICCVYIIHIHGYNYDILFKFVWYHIKIILIYKVYASHIVVIFYVYYLYISIYTHCYIFRQGHDSAPGLDIMLLTQQFLTVSGQAASPARQHPPVEYMYRSSHPLLQFLPQKLA